MESDAFKIADQALEGFLKGAVVLPVAEVGDEILANLAGGIFAGAVPTGATSGAVTVKTAGGTTLNSYVAFQVP